MERRKYEELILDDYSFIAREAGLMDKSMIIMENYALKGYYERGDAEGKKEFEKDIVAIRRVRKLMYSYVDSYDMMTEETGE